jgi:hypothetical protein
MKLSPGEVIAMTARAESLQQPVWTEWDELARFIRPSMGGIVSPFTEGDKRTRHIFDSTALQAKDDLAHYLAAGLTPAASPWLDLSFRDSRTDKDDTAKEWLQECAQILNAEFLRSNFYAVMGEVYGDVATFGSAVLQCTERRRNKQFDGLHFEAVWLREVLALPDQYNELTTTFRCYSRSAQQWFELFGDDISPDMKKIRAEKPETLCEVVHAVYPRDEQDVDWEGVSRGRVDGKRMPFASTWVEKKTKFVIREGGYMELPRYVVRWATASNAVWGYGPGHLALPDIRTLNRAVELELSAWERTINRPFKTTVNNIVGETLDMGAGGVTTVRDVNAILPLMEGIDFSLTAVKTDELRASILKTFFADLIREPEGTTEKTAYEVARRLERAQRILGESISHLRGMLKWVVERSFQVLYREGRLPPVPETIAGSQIDVKYTSPLQLSQEAQGVEQLTMFLGDIAQMATLQAEVGMQPDVMDWADFDGAVQEIARRRNTAATAVRSAKDVKSIREARQAQQKIDQALETAKTQAQAARNVGTFDPEGAKAISGA